MRSMHLFQGTQAVEGQGQNAKVHAHIQRAHFHVPKPTTLITLYITTGWANT